MLQPLLQIDLPGIPKIRSGKVRELFDLGYVPVSEVAGRGESARRGGIVDVFPPSMALPIRIEFFGDEIDSLRAFDPTDQRTVGALDEAVLLPASEFLQPHGGVAALRDTLGRRAGKLPERLAADFERYFADSVAGPVNRHIPGLRAYLMKGERGARVGGYVIVYEFDRLERRNEYFPKPDSTTERWRQLARALPARGMEDLAKYVDIPGYTDYVVVR